MSDRNMRDEGIGPIPEELIPNHLLAVTMAEFHMAHHQDSVEDNCHRDDPE